MNQSYYYYSLFCGTPSRMTCCESHTTRASMTICLQCGIVYLHSLYSMLWVQLHLLHVDNKRDSHVEIFFCPLNRWFDCVILFRIKQNTYLKLLLKRTYYYSILLLFTVNCYNCTVPIFFHFPLIGVILLLSYTTFIYLFLL